MNIPNVSYAGAVEVLSPLIPGLILVVGGLFASPELAARLFAYEPLGYNLKILIVVTASYIVGLLLTVFTNLVGNGFAGAIGGVWAQVSEKSFRPEPWKDQSWRKLTRKFIGDEFSPAVDELYFRENFEQALKRSESIKDPEQKMQYTSWVLSYYGPIQKADFEWYWWYQVLKEYFADPPSASAYNQLLVTLYNSGWSFVLLMSFTHLGHWFLWVVSIAAIFLGYLAQLFFEGLYGPDPWGNELKAKLLRELRARTLASTETAKAIKPG